MSTETYTTDRTDDGLSPATAGGDANRADLLDELHEHLDGLEGVSVTEVDAHACTAFGCTRSECRLWRVDIENGRRRTLCPTHATEFIEREQDR